MPAASEIRNNFGEWRDKASEQPVEITEAGQTTAYLVSPSFFHALLASYRKPVLAGELSRDEITAISQARITIGEPYDLDVLPDVEVPTDSSP